MDNLEPVLARSHEFSEYLLAEIGEAEGMLGGERAEAAAAAAELVFEHGHAVRVLFEAGAPNSAAAMLRLQYESLLRAAWLLYAASDLQVEKTSAPLTKESAAAAKNLVGAEKMLEALEHKLSATPELRGLVLPLRELRDEAWVPMNAFVHCGLHPISRTQGGFPVQLAVSVTKLSNGVVHMAARLLSRLTPHENLIRRIEVAYLDFKDVLPIITPPPTGPAASS